MFVWALPICTYLTLPLVWLAYLHKHVQAYTDRLAPRLDVSIITETAWNKMLASTRGGTNPKKAAKRAHALVEADGNDDNDNDDNDAPARKVHGFSSSLIGGI
jgi:hypothetical protein